MFSKKTIKNILHKCLPFMLCAIALLPAQAWALGAEGAPTDSSMSNPLAIALITVIVVFLLIIALLANTVRKGMYVYRQKNIAKSAGNATIAMVVGVCVLLVSGSSVYAQTTEAAAETTKAVSSTINGLSPTAFYLMIAVIGAEALVILALIFNLRVLLGLERKRREGIETVADANRLSWWDRFNSFKPLSEESTIELDHEYDGIRELDNRLPPWWLYGFYCTIIFAAIYLYQHEVSHSAPSSAEEYNIAMKEADAQKEAYLKKSGNSIDEMSVKLLTDQKDLDAGKAIFTTVCKTCHGEHGEGKAGPNLTDDYWLHGGTINNIFKTIKYGVPGKPMQSWKDSYTPLQIAELASYIKSLHGTKPANAKDPQGDLFAEATAVKSDTSKAKVDTSLHK